MKVTEAARKIAKAVLYEGYLLYPYTRSATKNRQRWTFGGVYPPAYAAQSGGSDLCEQQTECLVTGGQDPRLGVSVRFLQLVPNKDLIASGDESFDPWEEAVEREVSQSDLSLERISLGGSVRSHFVFPEPEPVQGELEISAQRIAAPWERSPVYRVRIRILNLSERRPTRRNDALLYSMVSTHSLLTIEGGEWVSLLDPPGELREAADECRNIGVWPVLVGDPGARDAMLSSPIILYDYPKIAPESPGDLFDGGEIDEILSLRILTLSDEEKAQIRQGDGRGRDLLERTEKLTPDELLRLHGRLRELNPRALRPGSRVRLNPRGKGSDVFDLALRGMIAIVESIEQDLEDGIHLAVTLEDDPGRDLGKLGQPGHRFFFKAEEVEPL